VDPGSNKPKDVGGEANQHFAEHWRRWKETIGKGKTSCIDVLVQDLRQGWQPGGRSGGQQGEGNQPQQGKDHVGGTALAEGGHFWRP